MKPYYDRGSSPILMLWLHAKGALAILEKANPYGEGAANVNKDYGAAAWSFRGSWDLEDSKFSALNSAA